MRLNIKLLPPYSKPGESGELALDLPEEQWDLRRLAEFLSRERPDVLGFALLDQNGILTAEFMVNGKHQPVNFALREGDTVAVIPYICGG